MMMKKTLYLLLALAVFIGCKKQKTEYYPIPESLKHAALFNKNSYWIYINDTTHSIDSTFIDSEIDAGSTSYLNNQDVYIEIDYVRMHLSSFLFSDFYISGKLGNMSSSSGYPLSVKIFGINENCAGKSTAFVLHDDTLTNHNGNSNTFCRYEPSSKDYIYGGDEFFELGEYSSLQVNSLNFKKVRVTRSIFTSLTYKANYTKDTVDYYFSPGNGIVKVILRIDTASINSSAPKRVMMSWSLLEYKLY